MSRTKSAVQESAQGSRFPSLLGICPTGLAGGDAARDTRAFTPSHFLLVRRCCCCISHSYAGGVKYEFAGTVHPKVRLNFGIDQSRGAERGQPQPRGNQANRLAKIPRFQKNRARRARQEQTPPPPPHPPPHHH